MPRRGRVFTAKRGFTLWAMAVFAFLYLPIAVMALFAFNKPSPAALADFHGSNVCDIPPSQLGNLTVWNGFTTCWFKVGLHDPTYIPAIETSAKIAAAAAIVSTLLGLGAALALARMHKVLRVPFDALVYMTLVVPEIVIAVASLIFFVQLPRYVPFFPPLGAWTIFFGQVVFGASLAMLIIRARFVGMGDTLEEAGYDLGLGPPVDVPAGDAAAAVPGDHRGDPAVVHVLLRRLRAAGRLGRRGDADIDPVEL